MFVVLLFVLVCCCVVGVAGLPQGLPLMTRGGCSLVSLPPGAAPWSPWPPGAAPDDKGAAQGDRPEYKMIYDLNEMFK